jgi:inorganic pyrophosphatase
VSKPSTIGIVETPCGCDSLLGGEMKSATTRKAHTDFASKTTEVVIETPKGSRNKFAYEPSRRMYKLSKILAEGMSFPYDFGFVPGTRADDGDPIDVLVLTDVALFPGCLLDCILIGVIELEQQEGKRWSGTIA